MRAYWVLATVIFLNFTAGGAMMPFFSLYATSLGASLSQIALIVGVQAAVSVVSGLIWGRVADKVGRRKPFIVFALATMAIASFTIVQVPSWPLLIPIHVALGIASGAQQVSSLALMGDIVHGHPRRGRLVSGYRMSGSLAFSVSIVMSGWLSEQIGLQGSFLYASGVYALSFLISLFISEPPPITQTGTRVGFAGLARGPMRPLLILGLSFGIPFSAVFSVWPIWIADVLGHGRATFSQLWGIAAFVEVPCMLIAGMLVDRTGRRPIFMAGLIGFAFVYLIYVLAPPLEGLVVAQVLRGVAFAAYTATALTMAIELAPPEERGSASGLFTSAQGLAQISGSWIGGPLAATFGFQGLFGLASAMVLAGAVYSFFAFGRVRSVNASAPGSGGT